jgi:hypothetical protein
MDLIEGEALATGLDCASAGRLARRLRPATTANHPTVRLPLTAGNEVIQMITPDRFIDRNLPGESTAGAASDR